MFIFGKGKKKAAYRSMTDTINTDITTLEPMPAALLAEMFTRGIVVIPEEFEMQEIKQNKTVLSGQDAEKVSPEIKTSEPELPAMPPVELNWLGKFEKKVLVVVKDADALHINDKDLELLGKILGAVKLSMADIALVNAATHVLHYDNLQEKLPASVAFYFGIAPVAIGAPLSFPQFQVQKWNNTTFLYAPSLSELNENTPAATALKKELWGALKKIFG
jgi:hypothetical protein